MSLSKNEIEYLRLYAQKCDHRHPVAPMASFGLAAGLRAHRDRGGRMFEKRKQRSDKYVIDDSHIEPGSSRPDSVPEAQYFAPGQPAIWKPPSASPSKPWRPTNLDLMNRNHPAAQYHDETNEPDDNLPDEERLQRLYRILNYRPPEEFPKMKPMTTPKVYLKSSPRVSAVYGKNFNRNAKGWCASAGDLLEAADPAYHPMHVSVEEQYYYHPEDFSPEERELFQHSNYRPRPKSWHPVTVTLESPNPQDEVPAGDYNARPKAWEPTSEDVYDFGGAREVLLTGDYNPRPKPWLSEAGDVEDLGPNAMTRSDIQFGDYNPRPKAWMSEHGGARSKSQTRYGDYNRRPEPWQGSQRTHFQAQPQAKVSSKFGDHNTRAKAWKGGRGSQQDGKVRPGDFNPRPKAWRKPPPQDDSSSYTSSDLSEDDEFSYGSTLYSLSSIPACDV